MVNLWGPGAFDSLNPSASRPTFTPDNAPGDVDDWFKDCTSPLLADGTEWRSALLNLLIANLRSVVTGSGTAKNNLDDALLARAIQSGGMNHAVATGTANSWMVALNLALTAYVAGRVLWLKAPATNTNTTVTVTIDGLAARPLKKSNGADPEVGDLIAGVWYPTIDDGTNICVVKNLPSDIIAGISASGTAPQLNYFEMVTARTQSVPTTTITRVNDFSLTGSKASDASFGSGGIITIGPKTAGVWVFNQYYVCSGVGGSPTTTQAYIYKNGQNVQNVTVTGTFCSQGGAVRVAAGDTLDMRVYQNSGGGRANWNNTATPPDTAFNLYQISGD